MLMPGQRDNHGAYRLVSWLGTATWAVVGGGFVINLTLNTIRADDVQIAHVCTLGVFFALVLARLMLAAVIRRRIRPALLVLVSAIALWAAGSVMLNASAEPDLTRFPSPGEWLFLASYLALAGYLILDEAHWRTSAREIWLEALVVLGGTTCLAGSLVLTPLGTLSGRGGLPLLLALLYPLIDVALALLVVAQVLLQMRPLNPRSGALIAGLLLFAVADLNFVANLSHGTYGFNTLDGLAWAGGFALLVEAACARRAERARPTPKSVHPSLMVLAAAVAIGVLALRPSGLGLYLTGPAVLTLFAAGGRLMLALRQANEAAHAFALARTDDLTLLPNRRSVLGRIDNALAEREPLGFMLLDLDGFKEVNDTLGHAAGDSVLQLVAHRMRQALPPTVVVGRLGGDEYAVLLDSTDPLLLLETANLVLDAVRQPTLVDGIELSLSASIGITARADGDVDRTELLRRADVAMYQAKATRAGALIYDSHTDDFSRQRLRMAEELRRAIAEGQLVMYYQPQLDAGTLQVCGVEALVRWQHPHQGLLSPIAFLPAARREGLMLSLSETVSRLVIADLKRWRASGLELRVSLNCAPPELLSGVFLPRLFEAVDAAELAPESLVIEVTEDTFITEPERARATLAELRAHHIQIAIDDYGTGFSSLSYLRDLPVQELKMDRSFISAMTTDSRSRSIVSSTFQMARALHLRTVAEGVENAVVAADLIALGVDVLQGYHVARPMPADRVERWVREHVALSERRLA